MNLDVSSYGLLENVRIEYFQTIMIIQAIVVMDKGETVKKSESSVQ